MSVYPFGATAAAVLDWKSRGNLERFLRNSGWRMRQAPRQAWQRLVWWSAYRGCPFPPRTDATRDSLWSVRSRLLRPAQQFGFPRKLPEPGRGDAAAGKPSTASVFVSSAASRLHSGNKLLGFPQNV